MNKNGSVQPKTRRPFKERSELHHLLHDIVNELIPSALKKGRNKARLFISLFTDPGKMMSDSSLRMAIGPFAFIAFAVGIQWLIGKVLGALGLLVSGAEVVVDVDALVKMAPPGMEDAIRCNLQAYVWINSKLDQTNTQWALIALYCIVGPLLTLYLRLRLRKTPGVKEIKTGQYLQFGAYSFGACLLSSTLLQALLMLVFRKSYMAHADNFLWCIMFTCFIVLPVWHYSRFLRGWRVRALRKHVAIGLPYTIISVFGVMTLYLAVCACVCDKM